MTTHIMLDLETLDTTSTSVILTIGAVKFDPFVRSDFDYDKVFHCALDIEDQPKRTMSGSTIKWWLNQSDEARTQLLAKQTHSLHPDAAKEPFFNFCKETTGLWGNGNMFDNAILLNLWPDLPFRYTQHYDLRTLKLLASSEYLPRPEYLTEHNALHDAIYQAGLAQYWINKLNEKQT